MNMRMTRKHVRGYHYNNLAGHRIVYEGNAVHVAVVSEEIVAVLEGEDVDGEVSRARGENVGRIVKMVERAGERKERASDYCAFKVADCCPDDHEKLSKNTLPFFS